MFDANALNAKCDVFIKRGPSTGFGLWAEVFTPLTEVDPIDGHGPFAAGMNMPFRLRSDMSPDVLPGATMTIEALLTSPCRGGEAKGTATVPPLGPKP